MKVQLFRFDSNAHVETKCARQLWDMVFLGLGGDVVLLCMFITHMTCGTCELHKICPDAALTLPWYGGKTGMSQLPVTGLQTKPNMSAFAFLTKETNDSKINLLFFCATITVDNTPPTIICPQNIVEQLNCGIQSTLIQLEATAQDNCGPASITYSSSGATSFSQQSQNFATMNVGTSTVIATATDTSQRTANCQFTVTIRQGKHINPPGKYS